MSKIRCSFFLVSFLFAGFVVFGQKPAVTSGKVTSPPASLNLDPFYKKYVDANGIPILASQKVRDEALIIAAEIVKTMLSGREDIRAEMIKRKSQVSVMAESETQTDLPECRDMKKPTWDDERLTPIERANYYKPGGINSLTDKQYWHKRARGMGGNESSCGEENLLALKSDRYYGENILIHEFSHNILLVLEEVDPELYAWVEEGYEFALKNGMYEGEYAMNTIQEYWAEATQWWFWTNYVFEKDGVRVENAEDLQEYDPWIYDVLKEVYSTQSIPADRYAGPEFKR